MMGEQEMKEGVLMVDPWLDKIFTPCRVKAHQDVMQLVRDEPNDRAVQVAFIKASLEGTMAAALQILGAEAAFDVVQPLVDRVLNPALGQA